MAREALAPAAPNLADVSGHEPADRVVLTPFPGRKDTYAYPNIAVHPVFDPSRQPWRPPALDARNAAPPVVSTHTPPPQGYVLVGLVTGLHQRWALLRGHAGKTVFLTEGQLLTGWTVAQIDAKAVHFKAGDSYFQMYIPSAREIATRQ